MKVVNIHSREFPVSSTEVGRLLDSLSSKNDLLWPHQLWPRMKFDKPLAVSAKGGHGPIRYFVEEYVPGIRIVFRFTGPKGFNGLHRYDVSDLENGKTELRHTLEMNTHGPAMISWPLIFRPLHDALIEDSLSFAELHLGLEPVVKEWSLYVRSLRRVLSSGFEMGVQTRIETLGFGADPEAPLGLLDPPQWTLELGPSIGWRRGPDNACSTSRAAPAIYRSGFCPARRTRPPPCST